MAVQNLTPKEGESNADYLEQYGVTQELPVREVRAAVSMVGGTSLAIYENGVAQELFRMVHGQSLYGLLKWLTHSHAYIDILSGTSAGGMNTIFLSTALTVGTDFTPTQERWIKVGGIDALLQNPRNSKKIDSLFRGNTYYYKEIYGAFDQLSDPEQPMNWGHEAAGIPSGWSLVDDCLEYQDLDLFVTGTYIRGRPETYFDARTKPLFNVNHAGVFHLKHRPRRGESHFHARMKDPSWPEGQDDPGGQVPWPGSDNETRRRRGVQERLARVARTTSSLPAVFEPSLVNRHLMNGIINLPTKTDNNYMGDGGYLNNRPLNLVLNAIMERPAEREVVRKVFFVEPSPQDLQEQQVGDANEPSAIQHAIFAATVPMGQSISGTLQQIADHNRKVRRIEEALSAAQQQVFALVMDATDGVEEETENNAPEVAPELQTETADSALAIATDKTLAIVAEAPVGESALEEIETASDTIPAPAPSLVAELISKNPTAKAQHDLWIKIRLQELRDQMVACWEVGLGLEDYDNVFKDDDPVTRHDNLQKVALPLRVIRTQLITLMEVNCLDLVRESQVPRNPNQKTPFTVSSVDATWLKRKVHRAISDIYATLYPKSTTNPTPGARTLPRLQAEEQRRIYRLIQPRLRELHHIINLAEIVEENLGLVQVTVAQSPEYKAAEAATRAEKNSVAGFDPVDNAVNNLWQTLAGCLRELLAPIKGLLAPADALPTAETDGYDWLYLETEKERRAREQSTADLLKYGHGEASGIVTRSKQVCKDLIEGTPSKRDEWRRLGQSLNPGPMLLDQIDDYVDRIVRDCAKILLPALKLLSQQDTPSSQQNSSSLAWALRSQELEAISEEKIHDYKVKEQQIVNTKLIGRNLQLLDIYLYPIERAAELQARNYIEVIQVSPRDVQIGFSQKTPADKISGDILGNLGGFLKSSWRANDILWGRLDGSGAIADTLWDRAQLCRILDAENEKGQANEAATRMMNALDRYMGSGLPPAHEENGNLLGHTPDTIGIYLDPWYQKDRGKIDQWLRGGYRTEPAVSKSDTPFRLMLRWMLRRHQLEILMAELPGVMTQALTEHAQWQARSEANEDTEIISQGSARAPVAAPASNGVDEWPPPSAALDIQPELSSSSNEIESRLGPNPDAATRDTYRTSAQRLSENLFAPDPGEAGNSGRVALSPRKVEAYFRYRYEVGAESLAILPPLLSLRRVLTFVLLFLRILSNSAAINNGVTGQPFRVALSALSLVFGILHGFVTTLTQGSRVAAALHAVALTFIALIVAIKLFTTVSLPLIFYVIALSIFGAEVLVLRLNSRWWQAIRHVAFVFAVAIIGFSFFSWLRIKLGKGLSHPLLAFSPFTDWITFPPLIILLALTLILMWIVWATDPHGKGGIVAFELAGDGKRAYDLMRSWGEKGRALAKHNLKFDALFAPIYSTTLALICLMTAVALHPMLEPRYADFMLILGVAVAWGSLAAGFFDLIENFFLYFLLIKFSADDNSLWLKKEQATEVHSKEAQARVKKRSELDTLAKRAKFFAVIKFGLLLAAISYFLLAPQIPRKSPVPAPIPSVNLARTTASSLKLLVTSVPQEQQLGFSIVQSREIGGVDL